MVSTNQSASQEAGYPTEGAKMVNKPDHVLASVIDGIRYPDWARELLIGEVVHRHEARREVVDRIVDNPTRGQQIISIENQQDDPNHELNEIVAGSIARLRGAE